MDFTGFVDVSMVVMFIGIMAFIVSVITEGLKKITWLESRVPTAITVIILSLVLCPLCMVAAMCWLKQPIAWWSACSSTGDLTGKACGGSWGTAWTPSQSC